MGNLKQVDATQWIFLFVIYKSKIYKKKRDEILKDREVNK